jgi:UDP-N-acetylmuramyl pentapeptide phosphotransferase/UDP-N-acetylglucosamine-1-phosphate transferase
MRDRIIATVLVLLILFFSTVVIETIIELPKHNREISQTTLALIMLLITAVLVKFGSNVDKTLLHQSVSGFERFLLHVVWLWLFGASFHLVTSAITLINGLRGTEYSQADTGCTSGAACSMAGYSERVIDLHPPLIYMVRQSHGRALQTHKSEER